MNLRPFMNLDEKPVDIRDEITTGLGTTFGGR
jgi:hypothetical protein